MIKFDQPIDKIQTLNSQLSQKYGQAIYLLKQKQQYYVVKFLNENAELNILIRFYNELRYYQQFKHHSFCPKFHIYEQKYCIKPSSFKWEGQILVLPYLQNLKDDLKDSSIKKRIEVFQKICNVVQQLHQQNFIHGDLKYSHFLLDGDEIKLIDYAQVQPLKPQMLATHLITATPAYMSPELFQGQAINPQSDLYALGIIFYELLQGKKPFTAQNYQQWAIEHCQKEIPLLPNHLNQYQNLLDGMLAKQPQNRYQDLNHLIGALNLIKFS